MEVSMTREPLSDIGKPKKSQRALHRDNRLKAALKANMAKRKAQVRARTDEEAAGEADVSNKKT